MKIKIVLFLLILALVLTSCGKTATNYSTYNQQQPQQPQGGQYVGGGCGVAPQSEYGSPSEKIEMGSINNKL